MFWPEGEFNQQGIRLSPHVAWGFHPILNARSVSRTWKSSFSNLANVSMDRPLDADSTSARRSLAALVCVVMVVMRSTSGAVDRRKNKAHTYEAAARSPRLQVLSPTPAPTPTPRSNRSIRSTHRVRVAGFLLLRLWVRLESEAVSSSSVSVVVAIVDRASGPLV